MAHLKLCRMFNTVMTKMEPKCILRLSSTLAFYVYKTRISKSYASIILVWHDIMVNISLPSICKLSVLPQLDGPFVIESDKACLMRAP